MSQPFGTRSLSATACAARPGATTNGHLPPPIAVAAAAAQTTRAKARRLIVIGCRVVYNAMSIACCSRARTLTLVARQKQRQSSRRFRGILGITPGGDERQSDPRHTGDPEP